MSDEIVFSLLDSYGRHPDLERKPLQIMFDDEPVEDMLYRKRRRGPTPAGLYSRGLAFTGRLKTAHRKRNIRGMIEAAAKWGEAKVPLSAGCCAELTVILTEYVPSYPCPKIEFDLAPFGPLLEEIWMLAIRMANERLQVKVGSSLYRWYEHHGRYKEARRILYRLMEINRAHKDRVNEAVHLNNFAFEYLLEKRRDDAAPYFEKAALIFKDTGQSFDYANSRANYWTCRFEVGDFGHIKETKKELTAHAKALRGHGSWHSRKPLILLAMLAEKEGNIPKAVRLVKGAIKASTGANTRYVDMDRAYLMRLGGEEAPPV